MVTNRKVNVESGTIDVTVEKTWEGKENYKELIPEENNNWTHIFDKLEKY